MNKKTNWIIAAILGVVLVIGGAVFFTQHSQKKSASKPKVSKVDKKKATKPAKQLTLQELVDKPSDVKKWTADPRAMESESAVRKQFKTINKEYNDKYVSMDGLKFGVIPGLRGAWSINTKTKKAAFGTDWVPQGLTQSADKYFISAYDGDHKLNSLIYQIDKKTRKYEKTLILDSQAHVGGITYEDKYDQLIYSNDVNGIAGFGAIKQDTISDYDATSDHKAIEAKKIPFAIGGRTSAITTYKNMMVVAKYGLNASDRSIILLPTQDGLPKGITLAQAEKYSEEYLKDNKAKSDVRSISSVTKWLIKKDYIKAYYPGWDRIQGVSMLDNGVAVLTQTNGQSPSNLIIRLQNYNGKKNAKFDFKSPKNGASIAKIPHGAEEVSINRQMSNISMIFESGAKKYRERQFATGHPTYVDRFAILPLSVNVSKTK